MPRGAGCPRPTCQVRQALEAGGQVALRALGVPEVEGLQGRHRWELPAGHGERRAETVSGLEQAPSPAPALQDPAWKTGSYRSCACRRGLLLRMRVWRWTRRLICGGRLSSLLLLRSR